jgi:hypothetical protein
VASSNAQVLYSCEFKAACRFSGGDSPMSRSRVSLWTDWTHLPSIETAVSGSRFDGLSPVSSDSDTFSPPVTPRAARDVLKAMSRQDTSTMRRSGGPGGHTPGVGSMTL